MLSLLGGAIRVLPPCSAALLGLWPVVSDGTYTIGCPGPQAFGWDWIYHQLAWASSFPTAHGGASQPPTVSWEPIPILPIHNMYTRVCMYVYIYVCVCIWAGKKVRLMFSIRWL